MKLEQEVINAATRIKSYIRKTPFSLSPYFSALLDGKVFFKLENQQVTGSFKARGALNKILSLSKIDQERGVVSASTGNHGAAVAYASNEVNIECSIYVPSGSSDTKISKMRDYGAKIIVYGSDCVEAESQARLVSDTNGLTYISPYNDIKVMTGQGTLGYEIKSQYSELDAIIISLGGGGLLSGTASYLKSVWPGVKVIACSPENSAVMIQSIDAGKILNLESLPTLSDGTAGGVEKDSITFPLCSGLIDEAVLLTEEEIKKAMVLYMEHENQILEGAAGTAVAALIKKQVELKGKRVAVVICGGNISLDTLRKVIN